MGQIFYSCAYDIESKTCCVYNSDKFHANCYAHSGAVHSVHYLLRQKPYNVMWGGLYVMIDDYIQEFLRPQDLLGLSTYLDYERIKRNIPDVVNKSYYKEVKFIEENNKLWKRIDVWNKAIRFFNWNKTHSVKYNGYLLNHTQKTAVNLADYYKQSRSLDLYEEDITIDVVPVLTETGGGSIMALFDGCSNETTDKHIGTWCGDLLQIADKRPKGYKVINCVFAEVNNRARYCYSKFGSDKSGYILKNSAGERYQYAEYETPYVRQVSKRYMKVNSLEVKEKQ